MIYINVMSKYIRNRVYRLRHTENHPKEKEARQARKALLCGAADLVGDTFNKWLVVERVCNKGEGHAAEAQWRCKCECGVIEIHNTYELKSGDSWRCRYCWRESKSKVGSAFRMLFGNYKRAARKRNIEWGLTEEQFRSLTTSPCFYTGWKPANQKVAPSYEVYVYNGIDRLDNNKGYTVDNCVPCAGIVNTAKMALSVEEFFEMCRQVSTLHPK